MAVFCRVCGQTVNALRMITLLHVIAQMPVTALEGYVRQSPPNNQSQDDDETEIDPYIQPIWILNAVITPSICAVGILGNLMNLVILTRRRLLAATEGKLEEAAYCGMAALATSDLAYCFVALLKATTNTKKYIFNPAEFEVYFRYIQTYFQNLFSYVSTWFTVVMTVGRYVAICHPFQARFSVTRAATRIAVVVVVIVWSGLCLPDLWHYALVRVEASANHSALVFLDHGALYKHPQMHIAFMYIWHVLGFIIPVIIMLFCNIQLVRALRRSRRLRAEHGTCTQPAAVRHEMSLTATLVLIVLLFFILVSPSEVLHFRSFLVESEGFRQHELLTAITNALNTLNFATNFLLYLGVNVHFRRTLRHILCKPTISAEESMPTTRVYRFTSTSLWCVKCRQRNITTNPISPHRQPIVNSYIWRLLNITLDLNDNDAILIDRIISVWMLVFILFTLLNRVLNFGTALNASFAIEISGRHIIKLSHGPICRISDHLR